MSTQAPASILDMNAFDSAAAAALPAPLAALVARRQASFGAGSVLFYRHPLVVARARGATITDASGRDYLDFYNNVPSVGHAHPRVAEAVSRQIATANMHSRYLHPLVEDYAERLLATFAAPLTNVIFTCSGSEANDLALRLARMATAKRGIVVTRAAYHGNTTAVTEVSPSSWRTGIPPDHVAIIEAPSSEAYGPDIGAGFARAVATAIDRLEASGAGFAAFLADSIFSSDGVFDGPAGFLAPVAQVIHARGGLYIADEVQPGFARTGDAFWGFARHGIAPDIVTMGKPMGNGYPVAGLVTRPELLEILGRHFGYFNTFGGTPAAAAAGGAVLDVIRDEGLQANALQVGAHLRAGLSDLAAQREDILALRGAGLYLGLQTPSAARATSLVDALYDAGILVGIAGARADVLKIRPPLCVTRADADRLIETLAMVTR